MDFSGLSDEKLVVAVREKNKELYGEIIRRYQLKLSHYLRKFVKNDDELADILQDVFIKAYKNLYWFDVNRKFSSWIYRIARNEALNHIKKYSRFISLDQEEIEIVDKTESVIGQTDKKIAKEEVIRGLNELKSKYREPFILYFFEERTYEEISEILHIPKNTVGTLILRGKKSLQEFFQRKKYGR